jgi:hypothetical protein
MNLIRWRLNEAEAEAPMPPKASVVMRDEAWLRKLDRAMRQIGELAYDARTAPVQPHGCRVVFEDETGNPTVNVLPVLQFSIDPPGELTLRLRQNGEKRFPAGAARCAFISISGDPLLDTIAEIRADGDILIRNAIGPDLAQKWSGVKANDPKPFGLIIY